MRKLLGFLFLVLYGCGSSVSPSEKYVYVQAPESEKPKTEEPKKEDPDPTPGCDQGKTISFEQLAPLIKGKCVSCHPAYTNYNDVVSRLDEMIKRINLPFNDSRRMPLSPLPVLERSEINIFEQFKADGAKELSECKNETAQINFKFQTLNDIEQDILNDLNKLSDVQKLQARYLILSHKYDSEVLSSDLLHYAASLNKGLNSVSGAEVLIPPTPINNTETIYRFFLGDYKLNKYDWNTILNSDQIKFISNTELGNQIKALTGSNQAWLHADNFLFISLGDPTVYNKLIRLPSRFDLFIKDELGIDLAQEAVKFNLRIIGFNSSKISLQKNRLIIRAQNADGNRYLYFTNDTNSNFAANKNAFEFPFPRFIPNTKAIFNFDAGEFIFTLKNGLQGYGLTNNRFLIQTEAPGDVVENTDSPFSPIIKNGLDCFRCHSKGLIAAEDQIRDHVNQNASEFERNDVELVNAYYKSNISNRARFQADIALYSQYAYKVGNGLDKDTINGFVDQYRSDKDILAVSSFVLMDIEEFKDKLNKSAVLRSQIGQLLTGGTITFNQFIQSFPVMIRELRLGEEDIDK